MSSVTFIGDDDVKEIIVSRKDRRISPQKQQRDDIANDSARACRLLRRSNNLSYNNSPKKARKTVSDALSPRRISKIKVESIESSFQTQDLIEKLLRDKNVSEVHKLKIAELLNKNIRIFEKWDFLMENNFNILLYGVGSKKFLIGNFLKRFKEKHPIVVVNGFFPNVSVKDILDNVCECLGINPNVRDTEKVILKIEETFLGYEERIYIGINSLDGVRLRNKKSQVDFARLAKLPQIRLIASVDHVNFPLMWDQSIAADFNWAWFDATNFLPYSEETSFEGGILKSSEQQSLSSLRTLFNSLNKNAREIFLMLARTQLDAEKGYEGMIFSKIYQEGRRKLLVTKDSDTRLLLREFIDHGILKKKKNAEGEETFLITIETSILQKFCTGDT